MEEPEIEHIKTPTPEPTPEVTIITQRPPTPPEEPTEIEVEEPVHEEEIIIPASNVMVNDAKFNESEHSDYEETYAATQNNQQLFLANANRFVDPKKTKFQQDNVVTGGRR